jgi:ribose 5-phosphate isomerase RpiB
MANVCCLPVRFISQEESISILEAFLDTEFEWRALKKS